MTVLNLLKEEEFGTVVRNTNLVVVHFYADWVDQCQHMSKVFDELSKQVEYKNIKFAKLPAEDVPEVSLKYNVSAVPTFILLKQGNEVDRVEGANPGVLTSKLKHFASMTVTSHKEAAEPPEELNSRLKRLINSAPVMLFMKGTAGEPRCGFSRQTIEILNSFNVQYRTFDILSDNEVREGLKKYSEWPTYPQLYIKGELVGGLDIIKEMVSTGEFKKKLEQDVFSGQPKAQNLDDRLKMLVNKAPVMVFMKGNRDFPKCGFSKQLVELLKSIGAQYETFDILEDEEVRQGLKTFSDWPTYPQIYVKGEFIGGLDIARDLHAGNELANLLNV